MSIVETIKLEMEQIQSERRDDPELMDTQKVFVELNDEGIIVKRRYDVQPLSMFNASFLPLQRTAKR